ncbi:MAG: IclR family transcriptional regulator [Bacillota bacterium]
MAPNNGKGSLVAQRTLEVLLLFMENNKLTLSEISKALCISKTATHRILSTLNDMNFLQRDNTKRYMLGPALIRLGRRVESNVRDVSLPIMKQLSMETGESVYLSVSYNQMYYFFIEGVESEHPVKWSVRIGEPNTLFAGSAGKAHLAFKNLKEVKDIINKASLIAYTNMTITDKKKILEEIKKIRLEGYSFSKGERYEGTVGISCPIFDNKTEVAVLSIFLPEYRFKHEQLTNFISLLKKSTEKISSLLI